MKYCAWHFIFACGNWIFNWHLSAVIGYWLFFVLFFFYSSFLPHSSVFHCTSFVSSSCSWIIPFLPLPQTESNSIRHILHPCEICLFRWLACVVEPIWMVHRAKWQIGQNRIGFVNIEWIAMLLAVLVAKVESLMLTSPSLAGHIQYVHRTYYTQTSCPTRHNRFVTEKLYVSMHWTLSKRNLVGLW